MVGAKMIDRNAVLRTGATLALVLGLSQPSAAQSGDIVSAVAADVANLKALFAPKGSKRSATTTGYASAAGDPNEQGRETELGTVSGVDTELASRGLIKGDIRTFDVAKFKLGMSAREVARIATTVGMRTNSGNHGMVPFDPTQHGIQVASFQTRVAAAAAVRQHRPPPRPVKVVGEVTLIGTNDDRAVVHFFTTEDGPRVSAVTFITSFFGATPKSYLEALTAKYGRPKESSISGELLSASWCAAGDPQCNDRPSLKMNSSQIHVNIMLDAGFLALQDLERRIDAAAAATAAATATKPTF